MDYFIGVAVIDFQFVTIFLTFSIAGELTAHCVGPHKVAYCELYDHGDGTFTLNVKPQEAGRHSLTVKYGGKKCLIFYLNKL